MVHEHLQIVRKHLRMAHEGFNLQYANGNKRKQLAKQLLIRTYVCK